MKKRKLSKRLLSYILCLVMVISLVPMNAITAQAEGGSNTTFEYGNYKILMLSGYIDEGDGNFSCQVCGEPVFKNYNLESDYVDLLDSSVVGVYECWYCGEEGIHFGITMKTPLPNALPCPHCCKGKVCSAHDNTHSNERYDIQSVCYFPCRANSDDEEHCDNSEHVFERLDITCEYCRGTGIDPYCTHTHHFVYVHKVDGSGKDYHSSECDYPDCDVDGDLPNSGYDCNTDGPDGACSYCGFKAEAPAHTHTKGTYHEAASSTCIAAGNIEYWDCCLCEAKIDVNDKVIEDITIPREKVITSAIDTNSNGFKGEGCENLLDSNTDTKWCCSFDGETFVVIKASEPVIISNYTITTAGDTSQYKDRNPKSWTLLACNDYNEAEKKGTWEEIDSISNGDMPNENTTAKTFNISSTKKYQYYKWNVTSIVGGSILQVSEFELHALHSFENNDANTHKCSFCNTTGEHDFSDGTCKGVCTVCGASNTSGNHDFVAIEGDSENHKCSVCGTQRNHDFSQNGTCACGLIQIEFEIINDDEKTVRVTGLNKEFDMTHDLFIPSTVEVNGEDYSVTEIDVQAFWECNIIGEVVIPDSVITIGDYAFSECGNIERISIPCAIDPCEIYWGIDSEKIVQRSHDFSNGALKCNLCGTCKALSENGKHNFNDEFKCTNCGQVDQFGVYFSQYKDLITVENDEDNPWDMDYQYIVPGNVDSYAYSSMTITAKKRVVISFSYSFDNSPQGKDKLVIKRTTKEGEYEEERYSSNYYNGEYPYDSGNRDPLILYPGDTLQIDHYFGSEYEDEGIKLGEFKINEITYVEIKGMSLELDPVYGEYIGVNLYIDASDNASLYFDDMPVTPDGEEVKLVIDDNTGIKKIQYRCAVKEFADIHKLVACDGDGNTIDLSIDQYTDVEEFTYSGMSYCDAVLAGGTEYSDELKDVCNALIEFNEQARNYFEYNNDGLNVGSVTADIPTTGYEASMTGKLPEGCSYIGSSLVLEDQLVLRHYFVGDISSEVISCVATTNNKAVEITTGNTADDRMTYVDIAAPYSQIADMYTVIIREGETAYTLTYGVLTYCNKAYELGQNSELVNTCNAMYNYSVAVNAYFSIGQ